jgi:hypothetical protein
MVPLLNIEVKCNGVKSNFTVKVALEFCTSVAQNALVHILFLRNFSTKSIRNSLGHPVWCGG